jgi:GntR family transcriptional regulator
MGLAAMEIKIDFRSSAPIYVQITEQIRQKVANGELKAGDRLPTVRQLATELRVNFNTVARAYRILDKSGLISTQQGRGTYIWEQPPKETIQKLKQQGLEGLTNRYLSEAARQGFTPEEVSAALLQNLRKWIDGDTPTEHYPER